jgi:mRNA interferase MazF
LAFTYLPFWGRSKTVDKTILRGDMYYADLGPVIGSEQDGIRPVLVIQNNVGNRHSPTIVVAAITSVISKAKLPTHYAIPAINGLEKDSLVLLEQVRTIDRKRLGEYIGILDDKYMKGIDRALAISIGLKK